MTADGNDGCRDRDAEAQQPWLTTVLTRLPRTAITVAARESVPALDMPRRGSRPRSRNFFQIACAAPAPVLLGPVRAIGDLVATAVGSFHVSGCARMAIAVALVGMCVHRGEDNQSVSESAESNGFAAHAAIWGVAEYPLK